MSDATVKARFHGGPFDGETVPLREDALHDLVALVRADDGVHLDGPLAEDDDHEGLDVYRLSPEASGLEGDVEYAFVVPLDPSVGG